MARDMSKIDPLPPTAAAVSAHIGQRWPVHHLDSGTLGIVLAAAKVAAEAGELLDAVIKWTEGRQDLVDALDELGDVQVALRCLAGRLEVDPDRVLAYRWAEVVQR